MSYKLVTNYVAKDLKDNLLWSGILTLVVLWQMLLPGYILTLDMVFAPKLSLAFAEGSFLSSLPLRYLLGFFNILLEGWIIQKILLVALFLGLVFLALRFLPLPKKHYINYWGALFYTFNPFVYERFLAGHIFHLFAYACLPAFFARLFEFFKDYSWRGLRRLLFWIILIGIFSLHFLVMVVLIVGACFLGKFIGLGYRYFKKRAEGGELLRFGKTAFAFWGILLILSSYWLVPYFINRPASFLGVIDTNNQLAFKTAGASGLETVFNVLTLYGFWGEKEVWANYFLSPKDNLILWTGALVILFALIFIGIRYALKNRRKEAWFFLCLGGLAFIFACGLGEGPFRGLNAWLFDNIVFWRGFRDTQKFSGLLAFCYVYFGGFGLWVVAEYVSKKWLKFYQPALVVMFLVPIIYTYPMLGGFARQLQSVWYPTSWSQAKEILDQDQSQYQVLFLPWHQYLSLDFNRKIISANPAKSFFGEKIIQGDNMEVGGVFSQSSDLKNIAIQNIILDNQKSSAEALGMLADRNVKYILVMNKIISEDYIKYTFLGAGDGLGVIYQSEDLTLYQLKWYNKIN